MQELFEQSTIFKLLNKNDIREADILTAKKELSDNPEYIHQIINIEWGRCQNLGQPDQFLRNSETLAYQLVAHYLDKVQPAFSPEQLSAFAKNPDLLMERLVGQNDVPPQLLTNLNILFRPMMEYFNQNQELASNKFASSANDWRLGIVKPAIFGVLLSHLRRASSELGAANPVHNIKYLDALSKSFNENAAPNEGKVNSRVPAAIFIEKQLGVEQRAILDPRVDDARTAKFLKMAFAERSKKVTAGTETTADIRVVPSESAMKGFSNLVQTVFNSLTRDIVLQNQAAGVINPDLTVAHPAVPANAAHHPQAAGILAAADRQMNSKAQELLMGVGYLGDSVKTLMRQGITTDNASSQSQQCETMLSSIMKIADTLDNPQKRLGGDFGAVRGVIDNLAGKMTEILKSPSGADDLTIATANKFMEKVEQAGAKGLITPAVQDNLTAAISEKVSNRLM